MTEQDFSSLVALLSRPHIPVEVDCWSSKECAAFFKCSASNFNQYIKIHPKFPRPIRIPLAKIRKDGTPMLSSELWTASEVIEYANRCKDR